jgi:FixJ family two-component response regulator
MFSAFESPSAALPATRPVSRAAAASTPVPIVHIVDADAAVRESLGKWVTAAGWRVSPFASAAEFLARMRVAAPCCVVLNVGARDVQDDVEKLIAEERTRSPILFTTDRGAVPARIQSLVTGTAQVLSKPFVGTAVTDALRAAIERSRASMALEVEVRRLRTRHASLSAREREVMALAVTGAANPEIGVALGVGESSVKAHRVQVMRKMVAASPADLVRIAGLLQSPEPAR